VDWFGFKRRRRRKVRARPFPPEWLEILRRNVPYYDRLDDQEQAELRGDVRVFLDEKRFEGCGGLEMTDEIRVTIAAQACLLLLGMESEYYPMMESILVYPEMYDVEERSEFRGPVLDVSTRLGESWYRGPVVLSWDDSRKGGRDFRDGHNVVLHEFAHQLDSESGDTDGAPMLPERGMYAPWARVLGAEFKRLIEDFRRGHPTVLKEYGASNPAEFFAVATEAFFEQPRALKRRHPELYDLLAEFYNQDPAERLDA